MARKQTDIIAALVEQNEQLLKAVADLTAEAAKPKSTRKRTKPVQLSKHDCYVLLGADPKYRDSFEGNMTEHSRGQGAAVWQKIVEAGKVQEAIALIS